MSIINKNTAEHSPSIESFNLYRGNTLIESYPDYYDFYNNDYSVPETGDRFFVTKRMQIFDQQLGTNGSTMGHCMRFPYVNMTIEGIPKKTVFVLRGDLTYALRDNALFANTSTNTYKNIIFDCYFANTGTTNYRNALYYWCVGTTFINCVIIARNPRAISLSYSDTSSSLRTNINNCTFITDRNFSNSYGVGASKMVLNNCVFNHTLSDGTRTDCYYNQTINSNTYKVEDKEINATAGVYSGDNAW